MNIPALNRHPRAADLPVEQLAGNKQLSEKEKVAEASRQFEAVLLRQVLSSAQKPHFQSKSQQSGTTGEIYRDMVTANLADSISKSGSIGLARALAGELQHGHRGGAPDAAHSAATNPHPFNAAPARKFLHAVEPKGGYYGRKH